MDDNDNLVTRLSQRYLDSLLRKDSLQAAWVVDDALAMGLAPVDIYLKVLAQVLIEVGKLWHDGKINVADEHVATQITLDQMARLRHGFRVQARRGLMAAVASVQGNHHSLGARIFADLLLLDGWEVHFLGEDTPNHDLVEFAKHERPALVGISISLRDQVASLAAVIQDLRRLPAPPKILLGGMLVSGSPETLDKLDADGSAPDALLGVQQARSLLRLATPNQSLPEYLRELGRRVQELRRERQWSQEQLAQAAGLDRTYISMMEHGKQNLTLGAVTKLADALEVPLQRLLVSSTRYL
jgi:methanogenic corrinoid protein MtbC1/DNA-binding XRE family transcriptional regulator